MRVDLLTREYPPHIYGGAGVHLNELARVLRAHVDVRVRCFDGPREGEDAAEGVTGYSYPAGLADANPALRTLGVNLEIAADTEGADVLHSHTWYANMAGHIGGLLNDVPHIVSAHSLEPLRPWKAEQLGGGYALSSWAEKTAYEGAARVIAVSAGMRADILRAYPSLDPDDVVVVHNGIDLSGWHRPGEDVIDEVTKAYGVDRSRPTVIFVGRITRQKGLPFLLRAVQLLPPDVQLVMCAGAPDTEEIANEVSSAFLGLQEQRTGVVWIEEMLAREPLTALLAAATVFVCPSVYEPLGIVNLEAMALGLPVVGSATGGIPEVIEDGVTGLLVPIEQVDDGTGTPVHPDQFVADLAAALTEVATDPSRAAQMGAAGRQRAEDHFSWESIAERTLEVYRGVLAG